MDMSRLNSMSTESLRQLNNMVVGVLRQRSAQEAFDQGRQFRIGQMVKFKDRYGRPVTMQIERINTKTISGIARDAVTGRKTNWRVHPSFLSPVEPTPTALDASKVTF